MTLADLDDGCQVRAFAVEPALDAATWERVEAGLGKLCAQFQREGEIQQWGAELLGSGAVILIGWRADHALSGCRQDRLARLLLSFENDGRRILNALGLLVEVPPAADVHAATPRLYQRNALRELSARGALDGALLWDLQVQTLGQWRLQGRTPLVDTALGARILHNAG